MNPQQKNFTFNENQIIRKCIDTHKLYKIENVKQQHFVP